MDWEKSPPFSIKNPECLFDRYFSASNSEMAPLFLKPELSKQRILETFKAWKEDLDRNKSGSFRNSNICPDHIKSAAHLTYWLRRNSPIINIDNIHQSMYSETFTFLLEKGAEVNDKGISSTANLKLLNDSELSGIQLDGKMSLLDFQNNRERVIAYGNELFAFYFGFNLAIDFEEQKQKEQGKIVNIHYPDGVFIEDFCYFLKFKSVSPHSIDLIFRALLKNYDNS